MKTQKFMLRMTDEERQILEETANMYGYENRGLSMFVIHAIRLLNKLKKEETNGENQKTGELV